MKDKTKKILAGIGLGAVLGTSGLFMTGCSSDITFNQADLDDALKNINEYLETQNNYNSEYAKNVLCDYLLKGIERNQNNSQFGYRVTNEVQNAFNDVGCNSVIDYKQYRKEDEIKELCRVEGNDFRLSPGLTYREAISEYKQTIVDPDSGLMSFGKTYYYSGTEFFEDFSKKTNQYSKTTFENKKVEELKNFMQFGDVANIYTDLMLAVTAPQTSAFGAYLDLLSQTDVVMGQEGEYETFKFNNVFGEEDGEIHLMSYNAKFKDGILQSITFTVGTKEDTYGKLEIGQILTIDITEKIDDFTFDKSPY